MIQIVMKPVDKVPVVKGEGLYEAVFNGERIGLRVRAKRACEAERKMMIVFRHELTNKSLEFNANDYPLYDKETMNGKEIDDGGDPEGKGKAREGNEDPEDRRAADPDRRDGA